jgi:putative membrane protein
MGHYYSDFWGWHHFGWMWILPLGFFVICVVGVLGVLFRYPGWHVRLWTKEQSEEILKHILDRRYAEGEITKEEYGEMKRVLKV